jgi:hypothetical protein
MTDRLLHDTCELGVAWTSVVMPTTNTEYWPFVAGTDSGYLPRESEEVAFLEAAARSGFEAFRFGINNYGAKSNTREGCILERGRKRWEIRLAEHKVRRLIAFVAEFRAAGQAVTEWLRGSCPEEILKVIRHQLVIPPGAKSSYTISEEDHSDSAGAMTDRSRIREVR